MKKIIYGAIGCLMVSTTLLSSCTKGFNELNVDPINYVDAAPSKLLAPAITNSLTAGMMRNRNFNNELMQVTVSISDGDATVFRYDYKATWSDYLWNSWYLQLTNLKDVYNKASEKQYFNKSYQGISLVCQTWLYSNLTDTYGDIPYSESNGGYNRVLEPKFDSQKSIYEDMFKKLEEANTLLSEGTAITVESDPVYNGDITKWRRFCNSLYLRLLMRVSGKSELSSSVIAKIKEIVDTNPTKYPIITKNAETAALKWTGEIGTGVYVSPYVNGVRTQDFRSPALGDFFIGRLASWNDPRISTQAADGYAVNGVNRLGIAGGSSGGFKGVPSGYAAGTGVTKESYFYSYDQTSSSVALGARSLQQNPLTGVILNSAEVQLILAEAAVKGWISGSAEVYYYKGIAQGINYWVPPFSEDPNNAKFVTYVTTADIDWDNSGNLEAKLEQIHQQKYYALFMVDLQQWFEYRRTGHPYLPKGPGMSNGGVMPARMVYPVVVQSANPTNYKNAIAAQGPDLISTNVWWQKR